MQAVWYRDRITYGRLNERYRTVHELCYLILEHTAFDDLFDTRGNVSVQSFLVNMNTLFEEFVTKLFTAALHGSDLRVLSKERLKGTIIDAASTRTYATLVPDLVVAHSVDNASLERQIPIDIKYKLYDDQKLSTSDIYQSFTYALALSRGGLEGLAGIIYPGERTAVTTRLDINPSAAPARARITAVSLNVKRILDDIGPDGRLPEHLRQEIRTLARTVVAGGPS
jgi:5-methylcytosine-specific restriction enzyme subunit McrC